MTSFITSIATESSLTSIPRTVRAIEPSMSLSITNASREQDSKEASMPADSKTMFAPA